MNLRGSVVLITGASSGLGEALAEIAARRGAAGLVLVARRRERLEELAQRLAQSGAGCLVVEADVGDAAAMERAAALAIERFGRIDVAVANAGLFKRMNAQRFDLDVFGQLLDVNVLGVARTFQAVLPAMLERGSGQLVGISSVIGNRGLPGYGPYGASKAALSSLLETMRIELGPRGVQVTNVEPGFIRTEMTAGADGRMPWVLSAQEAAEITAGAIERGAGRFVFPWQARLFVRITRLLPDRIYDFVARRAGVRRLPARRSP